VYTIDEKVVWLPDFPVQAAKFRHPEPSTGDMLLIIERLSGKRPVETSTHPSSGDPKCVRTDSHRWDLS
jgi:hypothetical protein